MRQLNHIDDVIAFQAGSYAIKLRWTNHGVYTVTVHDGIRVLDDQGGAYPTEAEARLIARGYAQMYLAEHHARLAEAVADPRTIAAEPTVAKLQRQMPAPTGEAELIDSVNATMDAAQPQGIDVSDILDDIKAASEARIEKAIRRADRINERRDYSRTRVGCKPPTPAGLAAIRRHSVNPDGTLTVRRLAGQPWTVLKGLYDRIGGIPTRKRTRITALTYRPEQLAAYLAERAA